MEIQNFTGSLERGEAFVRAKAELIETCALSIHVKFTRAKGRDVNGYYRWNDQRMVLAIKKRLRYPRLASYGVGTTPRTDRHLGGRPYRLVWHEERFDSPDDLLVFVAGHEFWHFLCHTGQRKRDHETKANCHGFAWLREFREWTGPDVAVAKIPLVPPRPDQPVPFAVRKDRVPEAAQPAEAEQPAVIAAVASLGSSVIESARQLLLFR